MSLKESFLSNTCLYPVVEESGDHSPEMSQFLWVRKAGSLKKLLRVIKVLWHVVEVRRIDAQERGLRRSFVCMAVVVLML